MPRQGFSTLLTISIRTGVDSADYLILFSSSFSINEMMRDGLTYAIHRIVNRNVAVVHLCSNFSQGAEMTMSSDEVIKKCALKFRPTIWLAT
jgi:hypothetical protein